MGFSLIATAVVLAVVATGITDWRVCKPAGMAGRRYRWPVLFDVCRGQGGQINQYNQRREGHP